MKTFVVALCLASGLVFASGCSSETKKGGDPKLADPSKVDPRIKPADAGGTGAPKEANSKAAIKE